MVHKLVLKLNPTLEFQIKVNVQLKNFLDSEHISDDSFDYLLTKILNAGRFLLLPKIHTPGNNRRPIV